jgi:hypothetical protein
MYGLIVVDGQPIAINLWSLTGQPEAFIVCLPTFWNLHYLTPISMDYYTNIAILHKKLFHILHKCQTNVKLQY